MPTLEFMRRALEERQERLEREVQELRQEIERFRRNVDRIGSPSIVPEQEPEHKTNDELTAWVKAQLDRLIETRRSTVGDQQETISPPSEAGRAHMAGADDEEPVREQVKIYVRRRTVDLDPSTPVRSGSTTKEQSSAHA